MTSRKAVTGVLASILLAGALALGWQAPALAHDELVSSSPKDGAALDASPGEIVLTFNNPVQASFANVVVAGPDGANVTDGEPQVVDNQLTQPLRPSAPGGGYTVSWRVVSSDGHPINGTFTYAVDQAEPTPTATPTAPPATSTATPEPTTSAPNTPATTGQSQDDGGGTGWGWVVGALAVIVVIVGGVVLARRGRQRQAGAGS